MKFEILTLFPAMFGGPLGSSILKRGMQAGHLNVRIHNIRDYAYDRHHTVDDYPYGGGAGMVMKAEPIFRAVEHVLTLDPPPPGLYIYHPDAPVEVLVSGQWAVGSGQKTENDVEGTGDWEQGAEDGDARAEGRGQGVEDESLGQIAEGSSEHSVAPSPSSGEGWGEGLPASPIEQSQPDTSELPTDNTQHSALSTQHSSPRPTVILMSPAGRVFDQQMAAELAGMDRIVLVCGHYEGLDERVREHLIDMELSIGDYVLTGGELAAMVVVDAVARLEPGVLAEGSASDESHTSGLLEYPHYTRPPEFRGWKIPDILISGHHAKVAAWRRREALRRTLLHRPDMLKRIELNKQELKWLAELRGELEQRASAGAEGKDEQHGERIDIDRQEL